MLDEAREQAERIAAMPGQMRNKLAALVVQCPEGDMLCRVYTLRDGRVLVVPSNQSRRAPFWLDDAAGGSRVPLQCKRHRPGYDVGIRALRDAIAVGRRRLRMMPSPASRRDLTNR